jgi:hypothetical protein
LWAHVIGETAYPTGNSEVEGRIRRENEINRLRLFVQAALQDLHEINDWGGILGGYSRLK